MRAQAGAPANRRVTTLMRGEPEHDIVLAVPFRQVRPHARRSHAGLGHVAVMRPQDNLGARRGLGEDPVDVLGHAPVAMAHPVPTGSGMNVDPKQQGNLGPYDQREIEKREDVLCYTTTPLEHPIEVTGPIELVLYVSSSAPDTDFTGKLIDVHPDEVGDDAVMGGYQLMIAADIFRGRYRESFAKPKAITANTPLLYRFALPNANHVFKPGERFARGRTTL